MLTISKQIHVQCIPLYSSAYLYLRMLGYIHSIYKVRPYVLNLFLSVSLLEFLLLQLQIRNILGDKSELKLNVKNIIKIHRSRSWD